jgi:misacylated tRNA(Ala) deacylase
MPRPANPDVRATQRLYLEDVDACETHCRVLAADGAAFAADRSCFYPGGGGQPPDHAVVHLPDGSAVAVVAAREGEGGVLWHQCEAVLAPDLVGCSVRIEVDRARRAALSRYHTVLHVLNTIALRDHGGWITGAQIEQDYARIDFNLAALPQALCADLERAVNRVLRADHPLHASWLSEAQFVARGDLLRTLDVKPPVTDGQVRVVEIEGFDAQACGGTHVRRTGEIGRFAITRTENKGRSNKRLYVRLDGAAPV